MNDILFTVLKVLWYFDLPVRYGALPPNPQQISQKPIFQLWMSGLAVSLVGPVASLGLGAVGRANRP